MRTITLRLPPGRRAFQVDKMKFHRAIDKSGVTQEQVLQSYSSVLDPLVISQEL